MSNRALLEKTLAAVRPIAAWLVGKKPGLHLAPAPEQDPEGHGPDLFLLPDGALALLEGDTLSSPSIADVCAQFDALEVAGAIVSHIRMRQAIHTALAEFAFGLVAELEKMNAARDPPINVFKPAQA